VRAAGVCVCVARTSSMASRLGIPTMAPLGAPSTPSCRGKPDYNRIESSQSGFMIETMCIAELKGIV